MLGKKLLVRDLDAYASKVEDKLRSEDVRIKEDEKLIFLQLMELKLRDEIQCLRKLRQKKEEKRRWMKGEVGIRQLESILRKLRDEVNKRKTELRTP